jgi:CheY-like chemotaxis protein
MGKKILVADGSLAVRKLAESLLKRQGYEVLCAEDGASVLDLVKISQPDLIFLDVSLPVLDGHRICKELKGDSKLKDIPVIVLLDAPQMEKEKELRRIGANAFLVKPLNPRDILDNVEKFLKKEDTRPKTPNSPSKDKMQIHPEKEKSKTQLAPGNEKSGIDKPEVISALAEKNKDEFLDILETSDILETLEAPPSDSGSEGPHGFDWFVSELKKEAKEVKQVDLGAQPESKERLISAETSSPAHEKLKEKDKSQKKIKEYRVDEDQNGYKNFLDELKAKSEEFAESLETPGEKSPDQEIPHLNYDKMIKDLIESVSTKIAQEVAKKIDPEILKQILRDEVKKLLSKEGIKAN